MNLEKIAGSAVRRSWPDNFSPEDGIGKGLRDGETKSAFAAPTRFLHSKLEVRSLPGRGRCLFALEAIEVGELILVDEPVALSSSGQGLAEHLIARCNSGDSGAELRDVILGFYAGKGEHKAKEACSSSGVITEPLLAGILAHNMHELEVPPIDGRVNSEKRPLCGLWPLACVANHSLHPNITRFFVGQCLCYRVTRPLNAGDELMDNYLDPRLPRDEREGILTSKHALRDEGPDKFDAPETLFSELERYCAKVQELLTQGRMEDAYNRLVRAAAQCKASGFRDPAFTDILLAFADIAEELFANSWLRLECLSAALNYATSREEFSTVSCQISSLVLEAAIEVEQAGHEHPAAMTEAREAFHQSYGAAPDAYEAEQLARKHFRYVFGDGKYCFEALNPKLSQRILELRSSKFPFMRKLSMANQDTQSETHLEPTTFSTQHAEPSQLKAGSSPCGAFDTRYDAATKLAVSLDSLD